MEHINIQDPKDWDMTIKWSIGYGMYQVYMKHKLGDYLITLDGNPFGVEGIEPGKIYAGMIYGRDVEMLISKQKITIRIPYKEWPYRFDYMMVFVTTMVNLVDKHYGSDDQEVVEWTFLNPTVV